MTMTTVNSQTLTERQKGLAACACLMAQGDMNRLEPAVRMALDGGVNDAREIEGNPKLQEAFELGEKI